MSGDEQGHAGEAVVRDTFIRIGDVFEFYPHDAPPPLRHIHTERMATCAHIGDRCCGSCCEPEPEVSS